MRKNEKISQQSIHSRKWFYQEILNLIKFLFLKRIKKLYTEFLPLLLLLFYIYYLGYKDEYPNQP